MGEMCVAFECAECCPGLQCLGTKYRVGKNCLAPASEGVKYTPQLPCSGSSQFRVRTSVTCFLLTPKHCPPLCEYIIIKSTAMAYSAHLAQVNDRTGLIFMASFFILVTISSVGLRLFGRRIKTAGLGVDDWLALVALVKTFCPELRLTYGPRHQILIPSRFLFLH